jgi:hypothetical protein
VLMLLAFCVCRAVVAVSICHWQSNASSRLTDHPQQLGTCTYSTFQLSHAKFLLEYVSVSDPHTFYVDPDTAFLSNADSNPSLNLANF